jgi:hypothetical protein
MIIVAANKVMRVMQVESCQSSTLPRKKQQCSIRCTGGELPAGSSYSDSGSEGGSEGEGSLERMRLTRNTAVMRLSFGKSH